ncbi:alpha/beta fold hydrolase [Pontibacillus sp. HMF3514]|nr:alpha/beta fold hydrolase [Pontibacillus sp. HMF3514]
MDIRLNSRGEQQLLEHIIYENDKKEYIVLLHGIGGNSRVFFKQLKAYTKEYNVIAIHLPGHGKSAKPQDYNEPFSLKLVADEVKRLLASLKIDKAHFVGISLGSIIIHTILQNHPSIVKSAVLGGTITRFTPLSKLLINLGDLTKDVTPHMWLYRFFAWIMMPKSNHKNARSVFIKEAKKLRRDDLLAWFRIAKTVDKTHKFLEQKAKGIPRLYISGREDHLFLDPLKKDLANDQDAELIVLEQCGHVCNIEKGKEFNQASLRFLRQNSHHIHHAS